MLMTSRIAGAMATAVSRHNERTEHPNGLYDLALDQFATVEKLNSGDSVQLLGGYLRGRPASVILKNHNGFAWLVVRVDGKQSYVSEPFHIGYIAVQDRRIVETATLKNFNLWHKRQQRRISDLESEGNL